MMIGSTIFMASLLASCATEVESTSPTAREVLEFLQSEGMSCHTMTLMQRLNSPERGQLVSQVAISVSHEALVTMIENRQRGCDANEASTAREIVQSITGTYTVELIEETGGTGGSSGTIYVDSASSNWMCGDNGKSESPADYIGQYHVSGAYANRPSLKVRGSGFYSDCYLQSSSSARVYTDDDVRMCIGYWHVFFCGAVAPLTGETFIWH
jgi:hypothetical protein